VSESVGVAPRIQVGFSSVKQQTCLATIADNLRGNKLYVTIKTSKKSFFSF